MVYIGLLIMKCWCRNHDKN